MADNPLNSRANQEVVSLDNGKTTFRRSIAHLPVVFQTDSNHRFLSSTIDPLIQKGALERLDGFIGKQDANTRVTSDTYISATSRDRMAYQLEPTVTYTNKDTTSINPEDQVLFSGTYDDYINQLKYLGGKVDNHDRLHDSNVYSWNPSVDLDKLINYREYYWLPIGPNSILIDDVGPNAVTEINVTAVKGAFKFSTTGDSENPNIKLYKGNTYKFNVDAKGHSFKIMTEPYKEGIAEDGSTSVIYSTGVTNQGADNGTVTFTVPTTAPDVLYYQCGNHSAMNGIFNVAKVETNSKIDVAKEILGAKRHQLRTLEISNGMRIKFGNNVTDATGYANREFYVEGVGESITLTPVEDLITPESYATTSTIPFDRYIFDSKPYSKAFYLPEKLDYITIKRDSPDRNAWSRYNRWFHRSVIEKSAEVNGYTPNLDETKRAKRPIIEFDSGIELFNHGKIAKKSVTLFDTTTLDAFSTVSNSAGYIVDGVALADGMRVVFAKDTDPIVKNKIYKVNFVLASDSTKVINLTEEPDAVASRGESVFVEFGEDNQGKTFYFDHDADSALTWQDSQEKTKLNQSPLFNLYDNNHVLINDAQTYPSSSFTGSKIFSFQTSDSATEDTVLGMKIKYNTINNVGDIVFDSDHTDGTFTYRNGNSTETKNLAETHLHYNKSLTSHDSVGAWTKRPTGAKQRVIRTYFVDATEKKLFPIDFYKNSVDLTDLEVSVLVNGSRKNLDTDYKIVDGTTFKYIQFTKDQTVGDRIVIKCYSKAAKVSDKGIYEVPENLEFNGLNEKTGSFTYGQIVRHTQDLFDKATYVTGVFPGASTLRDYPEAYNAGGTIIQHEGSLVPAVFNLIDKEANLINAMNYCAIEYEKFYNSFLTYTMDSPYEGVAADRVDEILGAINQDRTASFPFFYDDMIGHGEAKTLRTFTVADANDTDYAIDSQFSSTTLSNRAVYVYVNDVQLVLDHDYMFSTTDDTISISKTLAVGDIIKIYDYSNTTGSFIPPTPSKLGIYPKTKPEKVTDDTYITNTDVIVKHDGSRIKAYGDYRDDLILELEKRIYNNIKVSYDAEKLDPNSIIPSIFQTTEYTLDEVNDVIGKDFFTWAGRNNIRYITNDTYREPEPFTYNYASSLGKIDGKFLQGHWRAIYKYVYDTDRPHTHPWEMMGHAEKPSDWESTYGSAPYTAGNSILWDAVAGMSGRYGKPEIKSYLPVDDQGNLKNPIQIGLVRDLDLFMRQRNWKFGDHSPAETAWRRSSAYPFSIVKMMAVLKPAKFFSIFLDNSRLKTNVSNNLIDNDTGIRQTLSGAKYHLETITNTATGIVTRYQTAGYQPWIVNYLIHQGLDPKTFYYDKMKNLKVQLGYKLGGFTDKENIKVMLDSISPGSSAGSKFIPDENYKVLFRTSNPVNTYQYSGVLIEKNTELSEDGSTLVGGYRVIGYSAENPYFTFYQPIRGGITGKVEVGGARAEKFASFLQDAQVIPYGHVFMEIQDVVDFLFGYGKYLEEQGFTFDKFSKEIGEVQNFDTSVKEFLYWTTQNWSHGSAITLSPGAENLMLTTKNSVVGKLRGLSGNYSVLDAGGKKFDPRDISVKKLGNIFDMSSIGKEGIFNAEMLSVQKEHLILFDNKTVFSDILYDPKTGFRQQRLKLIGWKTGEWNGDFSAPGFVYDSAKVNYWTANQDYKIGDTVEYQGKFYVAKVNHTSSSNFETEKFIYKTEKPAPQLLPNFEYKISQFKDFYNLETNNFDETQQTLAQKLIGYQSRDYLENLFANDISQYKFYQGYIREKGTKNAIDKLLKAQYQNQDISIDLYPEWMIRTGDIGNSDAKKSVQVEFTASENCGTIQSIELLDNTVDSPQYARSKVSYLDTLYDKPIDYTPSSTFSQLDYSGVGIDRETQQLLPTAGYPQVTQVQHSAFHIKDLKNLDVNNVSGAELIWVASKHNHDWDVFRITEADFRIKNITPMNEATQLKIQFTEAHSLQQASNTTTADYFAVSNSKSNDLNAVHQVKSVESKDTIIIDYAGNTNFIPTVADGSTADTFGNVYKFISVRLSSMDAVNDKLSFLEYKPEDTVINRVGDKVFADADSEGLWKVYEKVNAYTSQVTKSPDVIDNQDYGYNIVARNDGRTVVVAAPTKGQGTLHFLFRAQSGSTFSSSTNDALGTVVNEGAGSSFSVQSSATMTDNNDNTSKLGYSLSMSTDENFVVAGAPYTNTVDSDGSTRQIDSGLIKVYVWDTATFKYSLLNTINPPTDGSTSNENLNFGWSHKISEPGDSVRSTPTKYLFVSAPGHLTDTGRVYVYKWGVGADGSTYDTWTQTSVIEAPDGGSNQRFGHIVQANDNGDIIAISSKSPGTAGKVEIFVRQGHTNDGSTSDTFNLVQTLTGISADGSSLNTAFGESMTMSKDGKTLVIGSPGYDDSVDADAGAVHIYKWNADGSTNTYTLDQTVISPEKKSNQKFGTSLDINDSATRIIVGAAGVSSDKELRLDSGSTSFDLQATTIIDQNVGSGGAYTLTKYNTKFVIDERLITSSVSSDDDFGRGVCVIDQSVFVGAPEDDGNISTDGSTLASNDGTLTIYDCNELNTYAWKAITSETPLIDKDRIGEAFVFNKDSNSITDYLNYYDPVKGRLLGVAEREISFKTSLDPARYNYGTSDTSKIAWGEDHLGEVWWDLSKVKWLWYEQHTQEYKANNWGKLFPGAEIHCYEWVESIYPPSEYLIQSRSTDGVAAGITGIPYKTDDSAVTIKQKYDSRKDGFVNYYYFWVRNKSSLPTKSVVKRRIPVTTLELTISNPSTSGIPYFGVTDKNKVLVFNCENLVVPGSSVFNFDFRNINFDGDSYSVWKLIREDDKNFSVNSTIETKWWDSLCGVNTAGDKVPDPDLRENLKYGNRQRPRQSWYRDRFSALKQIIDYANTVLKENEFAGSFDLTNLNSEDPEPTLASGQYDTSVDTYADLTYINTADISGDANYLVKSDETVQGLWSVYKWSQAGKIFTRTDTQTYKTSRYWSYADWYASGFDANTIIEKQINYQYELDSTDAKIDAIVKVLQADTGGWKLFKKTSSGWTNVGTENGTIQLSTKLYDYTQDDTGFAGEDRFDDNTFDQEPTTETRKILEALKNDLFTGEFAIYYNKLFFIGLRTVLSEQTYVDWMFKTSFVNAKNSIRQLDQRKNYEVGTDAWVESYIKEVKPFATKLREYKIGYNKQEDMDGIFTDFDNPPFYDPLNAKIRNVDLNVDTAKLSLYPWKMYNDSYKKYVKSITVTSGGSGYTHVPTVTIIGGTTGARGPFQLLGTSSSGSTSGTYGYFYPLFTSEQNAEIWDSQNGGSGVAHSHTFDEYPGVTFYMPNSSMNHGKTQASLLYKTYETDVSQAKATAKIVNGKVTSITVTDIGGNYTSTPTVIISGGTATGVNPSDQAKAYAYLENDLVRDFNTTIKFDRVLSTSRVKDWTALTSYVYGDLIRYNNELYRATSAFTATSDFDENEDKVQRIYGDETGLTASDRTKGFYTPGDGMPGNELNQLMDGVDYGGTMVTGLLFNEGKGWNNFSWDTVGWDRFNTSNIQTFYADGSTATYTFKTAPASSKAYQVYVSENDSTKRRLSDVFRGDGSTTAFTLSTVPNEGAMIEFIPFDEDGVTTPTDDRTLDNVISGGLFRTALGTAPSDIILEGDEFVSPETSYAPEEAVPGQIFDTVDIKVYTAPESGVPFISDTSSIGDGNTKVFKLGDYPGTLASVTVSVDGVIKRLTTDYTVNVKTKKIIFGTAPANNSVIGIKTFAISGENYRVLDTIVGDGSTATYTTSTRGEFNLDSTSSEMFVTIDGVPTVAFTSSTTANTITITFSSAPAVNSLIQIAGFNKSTTSSRSYASIRREVITYDGSTNVIGLTYPPGAIGPYSGLTMLEIAGKMLRGPDNSYYMGDGSTYTYGVSSSVGEDSTVDPAKTITSASQVQVFVNGVEKNLNTHYTVDISNQNVNFVTGSVPTATDVIAISTLVDNHYTASGTDITLNTTQLGTDGFTVTSGTTIVATTFNNALGMKLRREVLEGKSNGIFKLRFEPLNSSYAFAWLNGVQLNAGKDYLIEGNTLTVYGKTIVSSDRLDVMYFALESATGSTGFRIFKDMLNRTFYKRISKKNTTTLKTRLHMEDKDFKVEDEGAVPEPDIASNTPGVVFIDKERIEYFIKSGNKISQIRRGTLGTGIKDHSSGAEVVDASGTQTIPYADTVYTDTYTGDGSTTAFTTTQTITSASQLDIFIGGQRLLLTSEDGSTVNYTASGTTVTLTGTAPASGVQVKILHKKGQVWYTALDGNPADGKGLQASTTQQAKFIAGEPTNSPE